MEAYMLIIHSTITAMSFCENNPTLKYQLGFVIIACCLGILAIFLIEGGKMTYI
jgi:hypothetical protein